MTENAQNPAVLLDRVRQLLDEGNPEKAMDVLRRIGSDSPVIRNAYAVCLMRMGETEKAVGVYRRLLLPDGGVVLRGDAPALFKTNYATALLMENNITGCIEILNDMKDEQDPSVERLRDAITRWKKSVAWWRRLLAAHCGMSTSRPVTLDFAPGEI
ncbi:MAG: tetratricopeptide repeat protein [Phycisphaerae bacterium]|nr:tetratricopeptide repeat protein [Phycisphaerae bacterium]